jgi:hypothetical protein
VAKAPLNALMVGRKDITKSLQTWRLSEKVGLLYRNMFSYRHVETVEGQEHYSWVPDVSGTSEFLYYEARAFV